jgi:subfamily B ATP-binding cassette protein MsbA
MPKKTIHRLYGSYVTPHKWPLILAVLLMSIVAGTTATLAWGIEYILEFVFRSADPSYLKTVGLSVVGVFLIRGVASFGQEFLIVRTGQRIIAQLQIDLFNHLVHMDLAFFQSFSSGPLISRFTNDVMVLRHMVSTFITSFGKDLLTVIFLLAVAFQKDWILSTITLVALPTVILPLVKLSRRLKQTSHNMQGATADLAHFLEEVFGSMRVVKAYTMEKAEKEKAKTTITDLLKTMVHAATARALASPMMEIFASIAMMGIILYGGQQVMDGHRTTGAFFSFIVAILLAHEPLKRLAKLNSDFQQGLAAAERIFDLLDRPILIQNTPKAKALKLTAGHIQFDSVNFMYPHTPDHPPSSRPILSDLFLDIPGGQTVALVGASGGGKSTILNMIPRFFEPQSGTITIDGKSINQYTLSSLRKNISLVSQEISLFNDTILTNILYGNPNASFEHVVEAAQKAQAHDFIKKLPDGYNTHVGTAGSRLSGGQRQRIAIARAILKNAPILLLDEATSALDNESERKVQDALDKLMIGRTTLVIAHRLSTIRHADKICVIDGGRVIEQGTHEILMSKGGTYATLYAMQR